MFTLTPVADVQVLERSDARVAAKHLRVDGDVTLAAALTGALQAAGGAVRAARVRRDRLVGTRGAVVAAVHRRVDTQHRAALARQVRDRPLAADQSLRAVYTTTRTTQQASAFGAVVSKFSRSEFIMHRVSKNY